MIETIENLDRKHVDFPLNLQQHNYKIDLGSRCSIDSESGESVPADKIKSDIPPNIYTNSVYSNRP